MNADNPIIFNLWPVVPELLLALAGLVLVISGAVLRERISRSSVLFTIIVFILAFVLIIICPNGESFNASLISNSYTRFLKALIIIGAIAATWMANSSAKRLASTEFYILIIFSALGMAMMVSANDFLTLYLGLEMQSLCLYILTTLNRDSAKASEAGLKYFVLGALSSAMFLYGASLIYGFTGTINFATIASHVDWQGDNLGFILGMVFVICGFAFKISAVPFHMWTPDVYEGAPTVITGFIAGAPKVAAMGVFVRLAIATFEPASHDWQQVIAFLAVASMVLGAFAAIGQTNLKRLLAYSSIGHMGYALIGLVAGTQTGIQAVMIYLTIYLIMVIGAFACLLALRRGDVSFDKISDLSGIAKNNRLLALAFGAIVVSLAGIPPFAGFFAKFYVFIAAIEEGFYWLVVIGVLSSLVGAFYYLRIVKVMFFDEEIEHFSPADIGLKVMFGFSAIIAALYVLGVSWFNYLGSQAAAALF